MTVALDTSAVVAVVLGEPDAEVFLTAMRGSAGDLVMSAATRVETGIVVEARQGPAAIEDLRLLLDTLRVCVVALDDDQASLALAAWRRFGKGRHPAALNLGDCFVYAVARAESAPLLYKGQDFSQTDISSAL